jgi:hypothetical protein
MRIANFGMPLIHRGLGPLAASVQRTMTATIDAIDKSASAITFVGPNGWKDTRHIVDPTVLDKVKVGDKVDITWRQRLKRGVFTSIVALQTAINRFITDANGSPSRSSGLNPPTPSSPLSSAGDKR